MKGEPIVVVPWAPRPLIVPGDGEHRPDGLDEFVDELIEDDLDTEPRWHDVALLAGGAGVVVGATAGGDSPAVAFTGAMAALLASVSLAGTVWRRIRRRRSRRRQSAVITHGLPLVASHPDTRALITAYERLLAVAALPGAGMVGEEAAIAAHLALIETATVLDGKAPGSVAEKEYVWQRTRAVEDLRRALEEERHVLEAGPAVG